MHTPRWRSGTALTVAVVVVAAAGGLTVGGLTLARAQLADDRTGTIVNTCANPVLDRDLTGWGPLNTGATPGRVAVSGHVVADFAYMQPDGNGTNPEMYLPQKDVTPGERWTFAMDTWVSGPATNVTVNMQVDWYTSSSGYLGHAEGPAVAVTGSSAERWTRVSGDFTVPANATRANVTAQLMAPAGMTWRSTACDYRPAGTNPAPSNTPPPVAFTINATVLDADRVRVDWETTRTDITGWNVGRDGVDDFGTGAWSTDKAASDRSHTFNSLVAGTRYTFTLTPKTATGNLAPVTATATPGGGTTPPPTPTTTPPTPAPGDTAQSTQNWGAPVWSDDFNGTAPSADWGLYNSPGHQHGNRKPENCQVSNGTLKLVSEPNLDTCGMAHRRVQTHGRWEARVRSTGSGWMSLFIIWPDPGNWPANGEYDWREHGAGAACYTGFLHYPGHTPKVQEHLPNNCAAGGTSQWHNVAFEWSSTRMAGWVDGVRWYEYNCAANEDLCRMPAGHLTFQNDNQGGAPGNSAITEVDWVRGWDL